LTADTAERSRPPGERPGALVTRRAFVQASAAAAATAGLPWATGCGGGEDDRIVRAAIHPAVGIARVGNSPDAFFFGPEVPGTLPRAPSGFKDARGAVARQAARFRVYGLDRSGRVVRELTAGDAQITWRVNVANSKADWYDFGIAFDLPGAKPALRRNPAVKERRRLVVAADERSVSGRAHGPVPLDGGSFLGQRVGLGELMTDADGRLVFLPAAGGGYSPGNAPLATFSGDNGWADDVCDGPVRATVRLGGRRIEAEPAWVLATPPNYGPGMGPGLVSLYDSARSALVSAGMLGAGPVSFADDILPLFSRLVDMQWVNAGYLRSNGFGSNEDWLAPAMLERLADRSAAGASFRAQLYRRFRDPSFRSAQPRLTPQLYGDAIAFPETSTRQYLAVTALQYRKLGAWARGQFVDDRSQLHRPTSLSQLAVADQPAALDRAALESCLGGAYHPGIEAPWVMRAPTLWQSAFRLRMRSTAVDFHDWGQELTPRVALSPNGPLQGCAPGELTRWLGVPWHSDAASCRSGYQRRISRVLPTFWPARIPNQVLTEADYRLIMDRGRSLAGRMQAFRRRHDWERFIARPTRPPTLEMMVRDWPKLGMVAERPGPGDEHFPATFKVESYVGFAAEPRHEYGPDLWVPQL